MSMWMWILTWLYSLVSLCVCLRFWIKFCPISVIAAISTMTIIVSTREAFVVIDGKAVSPVMFKMTTKK